MFPLALIMAYVVKDRRGLYVEAAQQPVSSVKPR
jgi:hypothetical protein